MALLSQLLRGKPFLGHSQPPNLRPLLKHNTSHLDMDTDTKLAINADARFVTTYTQTIQSQNLRTSTISTQARSSFNTVYANQWQECSSVLSTGQTGQILCQRINGHKPDRRNYKTEKPVEHFSFPGHSILDLKVAVLLERNFRNRLERKIAEFQVIAILRVEFPGVIRDSGLFHCIC